MGNNPVAVGEDIESKPGQLDREELNGKPGKPTEYEYFSFGEVAELLGGLTRAQVRDTYLKSIKRNRDRLDDAGFEYIPENERPNKAKPLRRKRIM